MVLLVFIGFAQVALAFVAKLWNKKGTVFLNTWEGQEPKPILTRLALQLGACVFYSKDQCGRTLKQTQVDSEEYYKLDTNNRLLLPFGLKSNPGELSFDSFVTALKSVIPTHISPKRLWCVAGSGFLLSVLAFIWPNTEFLVVQVGKKVWPDQLTGIKCKLFIAPEKFADNAKKQPPYKTVPWYDAKLWQFVLEHGEDEDYIWNVGAVPDDIDLTIDRIKQALFQI